MRSDEEVGTTTTIMSPPPLFRRINLKLLLAILGSLVLFLPFYALVSFSLESLADNTSPSWSTSVITPVVSSHKVLLHGDAIMSKMHNETTKFS